jgi:GT2 family glycosyltransferase
VAAPRHRELKAMPATITISILNHQRRETLRACLDRALAQNHPAFEVLVVDNASTDGSPEMVEQAFPSVRLIRLPGNVGCGGRNVGIETARGDLVVTIDNDVLFEGPDALRQAEALFAHRPGLVCASFRILGADGRLSRRDWCHPRDPSEAEAVFPTDYVLEGACAFRKSAFLRAGGYWEPFFLGHEGLDLALRLLDAGGELIYWPAVAVRHLAAVDARPSSRIYYTFTRNSIWLALRNHRPRTAALSIAKDLALMSASSVRSRQFGAFLRGLADAFTGRHDALRSRRPLRRATYRRLRELRRQAPSLLAKAWRHLTERPI